MALIQFRKKLPAVAYCFHRVSVFFSEWIDHWRQMRGKAVSPQCCRRRALGFVRATTFIDLARESICARGKDQRHRAPSTVVAISSGGVSHRCRQRLKAVVKADKVLRQITRNDVINFREQLQERILDQQITAHTGNKYLK